MCAMRSFTVDRVHVKFSALTGQLDFYPLSDCQVLADLRIAKFLFTLSKQGLFTSCDADYNFFVIIRLILLLSPLLLLLPSLWLSSTKGIRSAGSSDYSLAEIDIPQVIELPSATHCFRTRQRARPSFDRKSTVRAGRNDSPRTKCLRALIIAASES